MNQLSLTSKIEEVSRRVIWFESPEQAILDPIRFMSYAMTYATHEDMTILRQHFSDSDMQEVLSKAPPGIFDARSWAYWNLKLGQYPAPPMPERNLPEPTLS